MLLETAPEEPTAGGGAARLAVRAATPADDAARDRFAREHPRGSVFHLSGWRRAVERVFGHRGRDLVACRGEELTGVLPLALCRRLRGRPNLVSTPYGVYGGPLGDGEATEQALAMEAMRLAERERVARLELRCREEPPVEGLVPSDLYVSFRRELPDDPSAVLSITPKDERRLVRRARDRHGLELDEGPWFAADLARLFHASKRRLGSPGLPLGWFQALLDELGEAAVLHVARRGPEPVAVSMSFVHGRELAMYYIGTTPEANREYSATSFLVVGLQEWAIRRGLSLFDLGRSRKDAGAVDFKRNQGFEPSPLHYRYHLVASRALPSFTPSNPRTAWLRRTWSRLPPWATRRLSSVLAPYLP